MAPTLATGLSISVVTYSPDFQILKKTLRSLALALTYARSEGFLRRIVVLIVDNGPGKEMNAPLHKCAQCSLATAGPDFMMVMSGHGNVGYGRGHNLAIAQSVEDYHLVLNPDVILDQHAIAEAMRFMGEHRDIGLIAPSAREPDGRTQYLCKRYPAVFDLLLRGFAPHFLRKAFRARLDHYEMRNELRDTPLFDIQIASGSFMFLRRTPLMQIGGFADKFFMYFEDFDLTIRLARVSRIAYVPTVKITHWGGNAARKGWRHIGMFVRSAITFYARHGWRWR